MKLIFLDIDGVLNSLEFYEEFYTKNKKPASNDVDERLVKNLQTILKTTEAKIVFSSSWRFSFDYVGEVEKELQVPEDTILNYPSLVDKKQKFINILKKYNIQILGRTGRRDDNQRGLEILDWLKENKKQKQYQIENYIVIDDDTADIVPYIDEKHFVHTSFEKGLTEEKMNEAINKLC